MDQTPRSKPSRTVLARGRFLRLIDNDGWEYAERTRGTGVVAVLAVTDDDCLLLTEQYRPAVRAVVIDLPAGLAGDVDQGEDLVVAAARELHEETGFVADVWTRLATIPTSPGLTSETVTIFLAERLRRTAAGGGIDDESITVHTIPLASIATDLQQQSAMAKLIDPKVFAGLWLRTNAAPGAHS
ncbi:MAG: NUDIX hydrolase [Planctomycetaceae bacterium]|nr:NUDIX hydrolase [Planctomycetaceae bacterium]